MRLIIFTVLLIVLCMTVIRNLPPPFPSPITVLDMPYAALLKELGPPADYDPNSKWPAAIKSMKSVAWIRPTLIAHWTLQVDYRATPLCIRRPRRG